MPRKLPVNGKTRITIRIDDDILAWFRESVEAAGGGNYQTLINRALREYVQSREQSIEDIMRRVIREELSAAPRGAASAAFNSNTAVSH